MAKVILVPLELFEERYTSQWYNWFIRFVHEQRIPYAVAMGTPLSDKIREGRFLDVISTNHYKATQTAKIMEFFNQNRVKDNDWFFFFDLWHPGLESLAYVKQALGKKFKIAGILHAGTYDPYDFLTQCYMEKWGKYSESSWLTFVDKIFVATNFHKNMLVNARRSFVPDLEDKIVVTGLPIYPEFVEEVEKENIVVFPHRVDPEKNPKVFLHLAMELKREFPDWQFLFTKTECKTKEEYYHLLNKSKISVSCASQETWGIAMIESVMCNCLPLVPDKLSYSELYSLIFKYQDDRELAKKLWKRIVHYDWYMEMPALSKLKQSLIHKGSGAIMSMFNHLEF